MIPGIVVKLTSGRRQRMQICREAAFTATLDFILNNNIVSVDDKNLVLFIFLLGGVGVTEIIRVNSAPVGGGKIHSRLFRRGNHNRRGRT